MTMTIAMIISGMAICMATLALGMACFSYARIVGLEKSTHKIEWVPVTQPAINDNNDEMQDLPNKLKPKKPKTIAEQMQEFGYPDIEKEMV